MSGERSESEEAAESSESADSAESADEPDEREAPEETHEPDQPEDAADPAAQEPDGPKDTADAAAEEPDEPTDAAGEAAEEADAADAVAARGTAPAQEAEPLAEEDPDAEDDDVSTDEAAEAAPEGHVTSTDADDEAAPEEDSTSSDGDTNASPEGDATAPDDNADTAPEDDATASDEDAAADADATPEEDGTAPDERAEATPEEDGAAPDKKAGATPEDARATASDNTDEATSEDEPEEAAASEASENTRTVALRTLEDAAGVDKTMAIDVADLPPAEPSAAPATRQEAQEADDAQKAEDTADDEDAQPAPLDLLAQLTNTPPPPATPARTLLRRVKIWSPLVALLALVVLVVQLVRPLPEPTLAVDAKAASFTIGGGTFTMPWPEKGQAAVMVAGSGSIGTFGEQKPVPTASVAKIMTAYVILREHPLDRDEPGPRVTVDARTVEEGKAKDESRIEGLKAGQTFSLQDMLKMLMIPSGNNVARLLARWNTKTDDETAFVRKMNDAARSLGMKNTTYTDPSGLDKGTVSTAVDQLKLAEAVMKFDSFRAVVALPDADIPGATRIYNNNALLGVAGLSVRGIKTGSNTPAGGTLSWAAYKTVDGEDRLVLGTMMDQHVTGPDPNGSNSLQLVLDNSEKVIKAVRDALTSATAVRKGQVVGHVDDGLGGRTPVVATRDLKVVGIPGQKLTLTFRDGGKEIGDGTKAGTVVGELTLNGAAGAERVPVALRSEFREPSVGTKLTRIG
ncbi:serine hydrolase [Streptomyces sp. CA-251387]|uniref:serine hydrolase n=1 Tax=Streptomyces sp. CA-251387 TaxID=3240064 RepID=UPI003D9004D1